MSPFPIAAQFVSFVRAVSVDVAVDSVFFGIAFRFVVELIHGCWGWKKKVFEKIIVDEGAFG